MVDLGAAWVQVRAAAVVWREHGRRARERVSRSRHVLTSAALVVAGLAGALGGGALIGRWCLALVLIAESCGVLWVGLNRDDGQRRVPSGAPTVPEILERSRDLPDAEPGSWTT